MIRRLTLLVISLFCFASSPVVQADIELLQWERPRRSEADGSGDFDRLIAALLAEIKLPVTVKTLPIQRIRRAMLTGENICMAPATLNVFLKKNPGVQKKNYLGSVPIDLVTSHVFSRAGEEPVHSSKELVGKSVAYWWRVPFEAKLAATGAKLMYVPSEKEAIQLLVAGRVDLAWGWRPGSLANYIKLTSQPANFDPAFFISQEPTQVICKYSKETQGFLGQVDSQLAAMRSDGRLKKILSPHAVIYGIDVPLPTQK